MSLIADLESFVTPGEPLAKRTWLGVGGPAEYIAHPQSIEQLQTLVTRCRQEEVPLRLLGGGSNVLVRDEGFPGVVVLLGGHDFEEVSVQGEQITCGAAVKLGHLISASVREGLAGLESLVGIPGTVGGALHGNAGTRGGDIGQWTCEATVMTRGGEILVRGREDLVFGYRESSLDELAILSAKFELEQGNPEELTRRMQTQWILKKASQPLGHERTGSIFKNPRGMSAGMLIDQAGLKGTRVGGAEISDRHANFIITEEGATASDCLKLMDLVRSRVAERLGVELEIDIEIW